MHDAAHYSLFKTRSLNDWVGKWLCAYPTWQDLRRYRPHHLWHHAFAGTKNDPDLELVSPFPVTTGSMARKLLRDFSGLSGLKHVYGLLAMDLGFIENTVSARTTKIAGAENSSLRHIAQTALQNSHGVVITNFLLFWILWALGHPELYALWIVSFLTTFSAFVRIRSIAEHAGTELDPDPFKCTRTTLANWLARLTVAPHRVNYHLEHHLLMSVPSFRFPLFHQTLLEKGLLTSAHLARSYFEVLKLASAKSQ
jgi:fatty acid desaturase